jgi:hypothetical protein
LLKHPSLESVTVVELDGDVIEIAKAHFGAIHRGAFDNPKLKVVVDDGMKFLAGTADRFDLIVLDLPDPIGPATALYEEPFFRDCRRALAPGGAVTLHIGPPVEARRCAPTPSGWQRVPGRAAAHPHPLYGRCRDGGLLRLADPLALPAKSRSGSRSVVGTCSTTTGRSTMDSSLPNFVRARRRRPSAPRIHHQRAGGRRNNPQPPAATRTLPRARRQPGEANRARLRPSMSAARGPNHTPSSIRSVTVFRKRL